jgi:hypothetical protein
MFDIEDDLSECPYTRYLEYKGSEFFESSTDMRWLLKYLNALSFDDGFVLDIYKMGYLDGNRFPELWNHIKVPFTEKGVWQAFLLRHTCSLIPETWRGSYGYMRIVGEYEEDGWDYFAQPYLNLNREDRFMISRMDAPQTEVCGETAVVRYTYWRKWEGLVKCTLFVTKKGDSVSFGKEMKETLIVRGVKPI